MLTDADVRGRTLTYADGRGCVLTYADAEGSQACIEEQAAERAALLEQLASVEGEAEAVRLRLVRVESELGVAVSGRASDAVEKQQAFRLLALLV
jgi:hypothetical protein